MVQLDFEFELEEKEKSDSEAEPLSSSAIGVMDDAKNKERTKESLRYNHRGRIIPNFLFIFTV